MNIKFNIVNNNSESDINAIINNVDYTILASTNSLEDIFAKDIVLPIRVEIS